MTIEFAVPLAALILTLATFIFTAWDTKRRRFNHYTESIEDERDHLRVDLAAAKLECEALHKENIRLMSELIELRRAKESA